MTTKLPEVKDFINQFLHTEGDYESYLQARNSASKAVQLMIYENNSILSMSNHRLDEYACQQIKQRIIDLINFKEQIEKA
jgi:hypothetical protein